MKQTGKRAARGRPTKKGVKQSATVRLDPDLLQRLDAMAADSGINRSGLLQIAVKAMTKIGLAATMKVLE